MFTGLIDDVGVITDVEDTPVGRVLRIRCGYTSLADGESIAVNGACLTVREHGVIDEGQGWFTVSAVHTTLERTTIGGWQRGTRVNLERAMRLGDRLGGHLVLGHVDAVGSVSRSYQDGDAFIIDVVLPETLRPLTVLHGSITVDGVSLTVNRLNPDGVQLSIIEYTRRHTTLGELASGAPVHVEADVLAKHVARLMESQLGRFASATPTHGRSVTEPATLSTHRTT